MMNDLSTEDLFRKLYTIRRFEEKILAEFSTGVFTGTTHTYLGQEANAVGILSLIDHEKDIVFSNHRCHGHFLVYGGGIRALFAELMGKPSGVCGGVGGSQHLHYRNFFSSGIQGGSIPIATGTALAEKWKKTGAITIAFLGDGTMGEGIVYEALNMASLWKAPILFVVENNHIAQTTPVECALAGSIKDRFSSFNINVSELDTSDVVIISSIAKKLIDEVRCHQEPRALVLNTERFGPHSKGDDTRPSVLVEDIKAMRDPVEIQGSRIDSLMRMAIQKEVDEVITNAFDQALMDPSHG